MPLSNLVQLSLELWGSIFCLVCSMITFASRAVDPHRSRSLSSMLLINAVLLFFDACARYFLGDSSTLAFYMVRISNFIVFGSGYILVAMIAAYIREILSGSAYQKRYDWVNIIRLFSVASLVLLIVSQFNDWFYAFDGQNVFYRTESFWFSILIADIPLIILSVVVVSARKYLARSEVISLIAFLVVPQIGAVVQIFFHGLSLTNLFITGALLMLFLNHELEKGKFVTMQKIELLEKDAELEQKRIQIMLSQIQPHFLYNSLATISYLCTKDAALAKEATDAFAQYLRANLDALKDNNLIPFTKELEHIKAYLWLEQLRFGQDLQVEYDIGYTEFCLPPLTVQPIVENAVKHGLCRTESGGTVRISTRESTDSVQIIVADDGVGFVVGVVPQDGRTHVGIDNVRNRLEEQCGGSLTMESTPGKGTIATLSIPKQQKL